MKNIFYEIFSYTAKFLNKETEQSSKRLLGAIGFICAIIFIGIWKRDLTESLLYTSAALLGLGILDKLGKK